MFYLKKFIASRDRERERELSMSPEDSTTILEPENMRELWDDIRCDSVDVSDVAFDMLEHIANTDAGRGVLGTFESREQFLLTLNQPKFMYRVQLLKIVGDLMKDGGVIELFAIKGALALFMGFALSTDPDISRSALRVLQNLCSEDVAIQLLIDLDGLKLLKPVLKSTDEVVQRRLLGLLSNVLGDAPGAQVVSEFLKEGPFIHYLNSTNYTIRKRMMFVLSELVRFECTSVFTDSITARVEELKVDSDDEIRILALEIQEGFIGLFYDAR